MTAIRSSSNYIRMIAARLLSILIWIFLPTLLFLPSRSLAQSSQQEAALGESRRLNAEALTLYRAGKFSEAEPLLKRSLAIGETALGPEHPDVATILDNLAELYHAQGRYAEAEQNWHKGLAILERSLGSKHPRVAWMLNNFADFYSSRGRYAESEELYQRAIAIKEDSLGQDDWQVAVSLQGLGVLYYTQGKYSQAEPLFQRGLAIAENGLGPEHKKLVEQFVESLAWVYHEWGKYSLAQRHYDRLWDIQIKVQGLKNPSMARILSRLATLYRDVGVYPIAEALQWSSLSVIADTLGPTHSAFATGLGDLAVGYMDQGHYSLAELLLNRALAILQKNQGSEHPHIVAVLLNLAEVYRKQGQYDRVEPLIHRAVAILDKNPEPGNRIMAGTMAASFNNLGKLYHAQQEYLRAETLYKRALEILEKHLGHEHINVAHTLNNLAELYDDQGQHDKAEPLYRRALAIWEKIFSEKDNPMLLGSLSKLARMLARTGPIQQALALYERARIIHLNVGRLRLWDESYRMLDQPTNLRNYIELLASIERDPRGDSSARSANHQAFLAAEQIRSGLASSALAKAAAWATAPNPNAKDLLRKFEDFRIRIEAARVALAEESRKFTEQPSYQPRFSFDLIQGLFQQFEIGKQIPGERYARIAFPEPVDVAAVREMLHLDEALVSFFMLDDRLLIWLVRKGTESVYRDIPIAKADLTRLVARVRGSLDQSTNRDPETGRLAPVDVSGAHELYKLLLAPLRDRLTGVKNLLIVPDEVLLPLPLGALVTQTQGQPYRTLSELYTKKISPSAAELTDYAKLSWLAREYAITVLPSATSLRALRQIPRTKSGDIEPLIAFGDPLLQGRGMQRGGEMLASRGVRVAVDEIRKLNRLPGTREELLAVAKALGADSSKALYLDKDATKPQVLDLNASGRLAKAQVVSFATHGLIGGEVKGLKEPALVLTPPDKPSEQDDGLLGLEDILSLKLNNTDWVILSACNTAAPGGSGEGLSGLVRAFFFAGAPSLLVSHWSVDDRATQALMTEVFSRYAKDKTMPRSEALRQGMLALMQKAKGDTAYFAHPYAWAPFFLVGEGSGETK